MSANLNAFPTEDTFAEGGELVCPDAVRVRLFVYNAAIAWRWGNGTPPAYMEDEAHLAPGFYSFDQVCDAIQLRSWIAGTPAIVTAQLLVPAEVGGDSGDGP